ncbi:MULTISPECIES: Crp/Fnr family transcriptional regulator [unclassified Rhizobium]|uniref:Crp/Fnr family transcriptional regulator n=1 Tax=unclassified Rhizobium TaxID=2613769 RepID=UPI000BE91000|nr:MULTISPECIES: Crp/Fnr family transcriptional regulator [unclassified Rhizobium]MDF0664159.1 Crp/Fnr family transcriptional regulator [Rhizobium sp. BC49]PDS78102.1 GntR family transcriptional regulator [Rhizobium sp. L18]
MSRPLFPMFRNRLLRSVSAHDLRGLEAYFEPVDLNVIDVLVEPNTPIEHVYFVERGIVSVVTTTPSGRCLEVFKIGREGMTGISVLLELNKTPLRSVVQAAGSAIRVPVPALRMAMEQSRSLRGKLLRYTHTVLVQTAETALALGHYTLNQRLARWILMSHDRIEGDNLLVTHDFLAVMLGVRRPGISESLAILEGEGMIKALRANIVVLNRAKLIRMAGGSYGRCEAEYARVIAA